MTNPPAIPANEPNIISYRAATPLLQNPAAASVGFLLFGISFLGPVVWLSMSSFDPSGRFSLTQFLYIIQNACTFFGATIIAHAFRHSPLVPRPIQIAMFVAAFAAAAMFCITASFMVFASPTSLAPSSSSALETFWMVLSLLENLTFSLYLFLLLVLLLRVGRSIRSRSFQVASAAVVGVQGILWTYFAALSLLAMVNLLEKFNSELLYGFFTFLGNIQKIACGLMVAFSFWCIIVVRRLGNPLISAGS